VKKDVIVVDIDATLWSLSEPWWKELKKINPNCPKPGNNGDWGFYTNYMTKEEALLAAKKVHMYQYEHKPFKCAANMVKTLRDAGYCVIIASHRHPDSCGATLRWLSENNIPFDDLWIGESGKEELFNTYNVLLFIDDSPSSLGLAIGESIPCMSIKYLYNEHVKGVMFASSDEELLFLIKILVKFSL